MNHSNTKHGFFHSMMKLKDYSFLLLLLVTVSGYSQYKISGTVKNSGGGILTDVEVVNKTTNKSYKTNNQGEFEITLQHDGTYELFFVSENYDIEEKSVVVNTSDVRIDVQLNQQIKNLSEVVINARKEKIFNLKKLRDVEGTAIFAGKKTEVILVNNLTANKSTNNARQIYAQVVGLTINESNDGGLQLSIGSRGLDPNRTANFNTRQNDYDISADVLGYPESYYATPTEALEEIQIVRGAASLQYGTQFGGMVNFKIKSPVKKPMEITTRNTIGSFDLFTNFTSLSGTVGKFSYYTFYNYKQGKGFRPNSEFDSKNYFANLNYQFTEKTSVHLDYTHFNYLAQQAGGLTDFMFYENPKQSNRERNWFAVDWNLYALRFKHRFNENANFSLQLFGLDASRKAVGFRTNRVSVEDDDEEKVRDLILGDFVNWGAEARYLQSYNLGKNKSTFLLGAKYYQSKNTGIQGPGSSGSGPDFELATDEFPNYRNQSDYEFPNLNVSVFGENIFKVSNTFSITPGFRFEQIRTQAKGYYEVINPFDTTIRETVAEDRVFDRDFFLFGIGLSYKPLSGIELYGNISQNYRSITFNDIRTAQPSFAIDPDISDEKGFTSDIGVRGNINNKISFDLSGYVLYYDNKISYTFEQLPAFATPVRYLSNLGTGVTYGAEALIDWSINKTFMKGNDNFKWNIFTNTAVTKSEYIKSKNENLIGNEVEFVPLFNVKTGTGIGYKNFLTSFQFTYLSSQFTNAQNDATKKDDNTSGINGQIPAYYVMDLSASYKWKYFKLEAGVNNITDNWYFTRRATGYPGPGIIPSEPRVFYTTLEFVF